MSPVSVTCFELIWWADVRFALMYNPTLGVTLSRLGSLQMLKFLHVLAIWCLMLGLKFLTPIWWRAASDGNFLRVMSLSMAARPLLYLSYIILKNGFSCIVRSFIV